ncbi:MAG: hypothetical protein CSA66_07480 [Proteobacteria bacterium]|nr:MAG: hypothetical protein CSA66_07480 [Pseudomonadota bacterium]
MIGRALKPPREGVEGHQGEVAIEARLELRQGVGRARVALGRIVLEQPVEDRVDGVGDKARAIGRLLSATARGVARPGVAAVEALEEQTSQGPKIARRRKGGAP